MYIKRLLVKNYKILKDVNLELNPDINIFVGENDSGKSTILEVLSILSSGKINNYPFERQLKAQFFNNELRCEYCRSLWTKKKMPLPKIIMEAYFAAENPAEFSYMGSNNYLKENCAGIRVEVSIASKWSDSYTKLLKNNEIYDIPVELYDVKYNYFNSDSVLYRSFPAKMSFIDTTKRNYAYVIDNFIADNITEYLTDEEQTNLSVEYKKFRRQFQGCDSLKRLNGAVSGHTKIDNRNISIGLREEEIAEWKKQMAVVVDDMPFESLGFGTQNILKIEIALKKNGNKVNWVLMEEPENNLSFTNMAKLIKFVDASENKQVFISTHSSYVTNKLNLGNIFVVNSGCFSNLKELSKETIAYFRKLPGYNTLRIVLAEKVILVEGPTDELIIQRAYKDKYDRLPIDDGIDIIVVDSLAFKRYLEIAKLLKKKVVVVTDNDGDREKNVIKKYKDFIDADNIFFSVEQDNALHTIEPSVLNVNCKNGEPSEIFKRAISIQDSMLHKTKEEILQYMTKNKSEWAMRVFDATGNIEYPENIIDAIDKIKQSN